MTSSKFVIGALAAALGVFVASKLFTDVRVRSTGALVGVALVFGLLNALLRTILTVTLGVALLPLGVVTLFLIYLLLGVFVNMVLLWITDKLLDGFEMRRFSTLFGTAALVSFASVIVERLL